MADMEGDEKRIETGRLAMLRGGAVVRIVAIDETGIFAETADGVTQIPEWLFVRTYSPAEASGNGYSRMSIDDRGIVFLED